MCMAEEVCVVTVHIVFSQEHSLMDWGPTQTKKLQTDGWVWMPNATTDDSIARVYATLHHTSVDQLEWEPPISLTVSHQPQASLQCYALSNPVENMAFYGWTGGDPTGVPLELQRIWHCRLREGETLRILRNTHQPVTAGQVMRAIVSARRRARLPIPGNACPLVCHLSPLPVTVLRKYGASIPHTDGENGVLFCVGSLCLVDEGPREWRTCPPRSWINTPRDDTGLNENGDAAPRSTTTNHHGWRETRQAFVAAVTARLVQPADIHLFRTLGLVHRDVCRAAATQDLQMDWDHAMHQFLAVPQITATNDDDAHDDEDLLDDAGGDDGAVHYAFRSYDPLQAKKKEPPPTTEHEEDATAHILPLCPRSWILHSALSTFGTQPRIRGFARIEDLSLPYGPPRSTDECTNDGSSKLHFKLPSAFCAMGCSYFTIRRSPNEDRHVLVARGKGGGHFVDGPSTVALLRQHVAPHLSFRRFLLHNPRINHDDGWDDDWLRLTFSGGADTGMLQTCLCLCLIALYPMASLDEIVSVGLVIGLQALRDNRTFPIATISLCMEWQTECLRRFWWPYTRPLVPLSDVAGHLIDAATDGGGSLARRAAVAGRQHQPPLRRGMLRDPNNTNTVLNPDYASAQQYILNILHPPVPRRLAKPRTDKEKKCKATTTGQQHDHGKRIRHLRAALHRTARFQQRIDKHGMHSITQNRESHLLCL